MYRVNKNDYTVEELIKDDIRKYVKHNNTIFYISTDNMVLKSYNIDTKETKIFDLANVEQILVNEDNVFAVTHTTEEKSIYRFNFDGQGKTKISSDAEVSYAIENNGVIYFVNRADSNYIYKVNTSGEGLSKVANIKSIYTKGKNDEVNGNKYMFIRENNLYYINPDDEDSLWRYNLDDGTNERVISASIEILQNVDNTVFYKIDKEMGVYLYNYDTQFMSLVTRRRVKEFVIDTYTDIASENI